MENYEVSEYKIQNIKKIVGDEDGIGIQDNNQIWYYINRHAKSINTLGKGQALTFSNQIKKKRERQFIKEIEIPELLKNVQGLISEYTI